jgi:hypothetical protein
MTPRKPLNVPLHRAALGTIAMLLVALAPPLGAQACGDGPSS